MIKRINKSIYLKILLLLALSYLFFFSLTMETHSYLFRSKHFKIIQRNTANYVNLILDKVENLQTFNEIDSLVKQYNLKLRIVNSDTTYSFPNNIRKLYFDKDDILNKNVNVGFDNGLIVQVKRENKTYELILEERGASLNHFLFIYRSLSLLYFFIMLIIIYYLLRGVLKPLNKLHQGVKKLSVETLDKPILTNRTDELGELIHSFNDMKSEIKNMIQSREQLLLDVSHELRTPLTRTNISLEMMDDCDEKEDIISDMKEMETMISELLESAKIQSKYGELNYENVNIIDLIYDVSLYFENDKPGFEMINIPEKLNVNIDPERIKIMLKNIMSNAIKYSDKNAQSVNIKVENNKESFVLKIKNYGEGIPEKDLDFIFEPFYRVDKSRDKKTGGYGLGMHLVKKIVDAHEGEISISSKQGSWTEVTVKLPKPSLVTTI